MYAITLLAPDVDSMLSIKSLRSITKMIINYMKQVMQKAAESAKGLTKDQSVWDSIVAAGQEENIKEPMSKYQYKKSE